LESPPACLPARPRQRAKPRLAAGLRGLLAEIHRTLDARSTMVIDEQP
jgi:hypothetical protein